MPRIRRSIGFAVTFLALAWVSAAFPSQDKQAPYGVRDEASLFTAEAIQKATKLAAQIKEKHGKDLLVETVNEIPADVKNRFTWAQERARKAGAEGVYLVISNKPKVVELVV